MIDVTQQALDVARLYRALGRQLERIVGKGVPAPDVVDDACQFAWTQLVSRRDRVSDESALIWLTTTAIREAFRLIHRAERELSRDAMLEALGDAALPGISIGADEWFETRGRLLALAALPARQQRLLWLRAMGFQFTPKHASWLNQIEIFFSILWRRLLKHGIFTSEHDLAQQMLAFVETYNQTAKPFKWTYTGKVLEA